MVGAQSPPPRRTAGLKVWMKTLRPQGRSAGPGSQDQVMVRDSTPVPIDEQSLPRLLPFGASVRGRWGAGRTQAVPPPHGLLTLEEAALTPPDPCCKVPAGLVGCHPKTWEAGIAASRRPLSPAHTLWPCAEEPLEPSRAHSPKSHCCSHTQSPSGPLTLMSSRPTQGCLSPAAVQGPQGQPPTLAPSVT